MLYNQLVITAKPCLRFNKTGLLITEQIPNRLERYIHEAAKAAGYEEGFGISGCDLGQNQWYVAYTRQSTT